MIIIKINKKSSNFIKKKEKKKTMSKTRNPSNYVEKENPRISRYCLVSEKVEEKKKRFANEKDSLFPSQEY